MGFAEDLQNDKPAPPAPRNRNNTTSPVVRAQSFAAALNDADELTKADFGTDAANDPPHGGGENHQKKSSDSNFLASFADAGLAGGAFTAAISPFLGPLGLVTAPVGGLMAGVGAAVKGVKSLVDWLW